MMDLVVIVIVNHSHSCGSYIIIRKDWRTIIEYIFCAQNSSKCSLFTVSGSLSGRYYHSFQFTDEKAIVI